MWNVLCCPWIPHALFRFWLKVAVALFSVFFLVCLFFQVYLPYVARRPIPSDLWEVEYPLLYPLATACIIISLVCFHFAFWDVWGLLTPVILFFLGMGVFMAILIVL